MPLNANGKRMTRNLDRLDKAIGCAGRYHRSSRIDNALLVKAVDVIFLFWDESLQNGTGLNIDPM